MNRHPRWSLPRIVLAVLGAALAAVLPTVAASADDSTAAWAVSPCDAEGNATGDTRFELEVDPGESVTEHVLITNSSTVEHVFDVYGADGFNTPTGGYDLDVADVAPTDVGAWVTVASPQVSVAALSTALVEYTVVVPDGATPGDHPGGIVVSPVRGQVTGDGVVIDTRVAVRLNVRVPGDVAAVLDVRRIDADYRFNAVPFGPSTTTVTYEVVNTGNVKVVGVPRLRITGPFGIALADVEADETREVLPGDSFTVSAEVDGVAPLLLNTLTVDVAMTAAPGAPTDIPLVTSTGRTTFAAISWTGLLLLVVVGVAIWQVLRYVRRRRRQGVEAWDRVVDEARADIEAGRGPRTAEPSASGAALTLALIGLVGWLTLGAAASDAQALPSEGDNGTIDLTVPGTQPEPTASPLPTSAPGAGAQPRRTTVPSATTATPLPTATPTPTSTTAPVAAGLRGSPPDLLWSGDPGGLTPLAWSLVGVATTAGGGAAGLWFLRRRAHLGVGA